MSTCSESNNRYLQKDDNFKKRFVQWRMYVVICKKKNSRRDTKSEEKKKTYPVTEFST